MNDDPTKAPGAIFIPTYFHGRELRLLRNLENATRRLEAGGINARTRTLLRTDVAEVLVQLDALRADQERLTSKPVLPVRKSPDGLKLCRCGHVRNDHRPYSREMQRDGACLEDDCDCEEFVNRDAFSSRARMADTLSIVDAAKQARGVVMVDDPLTYNAKDIETIGKMGEDGE